MSSDPFLELVPFRTEHADALVSMWRASFEQGIGVIDPHSLAEQRAYLLEQVVPNNTVLVALLDEKLVGFIAATQESITQLFVHIDFHGRGFGTQMLAWAKGQSNGKLWLYTFARNRRARRFYEGHGFVAVAEGFEPTWQLDDVKYEWSKSVGDRIERQAKLD